MFHVNSLQEKRLYQRITFRNPVSFQSKDQSQFFGSQSFDLSEGGIRVSTTDFLPIGMDLFIEFPLGKDRIAECHGRVAWVEKMTSMERYQTGIEFLDTTATLTAKQALKKYLNELNVQSEK